MVVVPSLECMGHGGNSRTDETGPALDRPNQGNQRVVNARASDRCPLAGRARGLTRGAGATPTPRRAPARRPLSLRAALVARVLGFNW